MREALLKKALESGKTTSKAAQRRSRESSAANSKANSRAGSAANSRHASRETSPTRDEFTDDLGTDDTNSSDENSRGSSVPDDVDSLRYNAIPNILNRRNRNFEQRTQDIRSYVNTLRKHYVGSDISGHVPDLVSAFLKIAQGQDSLEIDAVLAVEAIALTLLNDDSEDDFEETARALTIVIKDSASPRIKTQAVRTLSILAFYADADFQGDAESVRDFLQEIIESDGSSVSAPDSATLVTAALEDFAFLTTLQSDMDAHTSHSLVELLSEQLDSTEYTVQLAAGEAIALLYEMAHTHPTDAEMSLHAALAQDPAALIRRHQPTRDEPALLDKMHALAQNPGRHYSHAAKRALRTGFRDIVQSVENPALGPRYSMGTKRANKEKGSKSEDAGGELGSRLKLRYGPGKSQVLVIDSWWEFWRMNEITRVLRASFQEHWRRNPKVRQAFEGSDDEGDDDDDDE